MKPYTKQAFFRDNQGALEQVLILQNEIHISISSFNEDNENTGYMRVFHHPDKRFYLDVVYCYDKYRQLGIASKLNELTDYLLKDYPGYVIRGVYKPSQLSTDRENSIERSKEDLEKSSKSFYEKAGYQIVSYKDYISNKEKYPYIEEFDFELGEEAPENMTIVAKEIKEKNHPFFEKDGVIYHKNFFINEHFNKQK